MRSPKYNGNPVLGEGKGTGRLESTRYRTKVRVGTWGPESCVLKGTIRVGEEETSGRNTQLSLQRLDLEGGRPRQDTLTYY